MKTVLAPGAPWPDPNVWTGRPVFEHKQKPARKVAPKKKAPAKTGPATKRVREKQQLTEAVLDNGVFKHPKDDPLAKARAEVDEYARQKKAIRNVSLEPKQIFYFSKAKASK
jgi:hypothetical protein